MTSTPPALNCKEMLLGTTTGDGTDQLPGGITSELVFDPMADTAAANGDALGISMRFKTNC